jgi:Tol biopolymer transport system component
MSIAPGTRFGPYEIAELIGIGGMGEVYRAADTVLSRDIAIKVLPESVRDDAERLARFRREAKVLASLNHPNIAQIYGLEETDDATALIMELVDGQTLAERLMRGPVPIDEALEISAQIAEALETAHERGIVHRDLKPANIKITQSGRVKVLDFGLAKMLAAEPSAAQVMATVTKSTEMGKVLGTPSYMSPEQVRGEEIDTRTDIWSFGVVLVEMLTGRRLFEGPTSADTMARVLERTPIQPALPDSTPPLVRRLIRLCLAKNRNQRLRHIGDARIDLLDATDDAYAEPAGAAAPGTSRRASRFATVTGAAVLTALLGWFGAGFFAEPEYPGFYDIVTPAPITGMIPRNRVLAISADDEYVAYTSGQGLIVYSTQRGTSERLGVAAEPFFSPDGTAIAFENDQREIVSRPVDGGSVTVITLTAEDLLGGSWGDDGSIYFATTRGLFRVPDDDFQDPTLLAAPDSARNQLAFGWPELLPGGKALVFTIESTDTAVEPQLAVLNLETLDIDPLIRGSRAQYATSGHLIFADRGALAAIAFDPGSLTTAGERIPLGFEINRNAPSFDVSAINSLVYQSPLPEPESTMVYYDRAGNQVLTGMAQGYLGARLSPDGNILIGEVLDAGGRNRDILMYDLARGIETKFTDDPRDDLFGNWSSDGETIYFTSNRGGSQAIYSRPADLSEEPQLFYGDEESGYWVWSVTPDGTKLLANRTTPARPDVVVAFDLTGQEQPAPEVVLDRGAQVRNAALSPAENVLAYQSTEVGGQWGIYLWDLDADDDEQKLYPVSGSGIAGQPAWSHDGSRLHYLSVDAMMMEVEVRYEPELTLGEPVALFPVDSRLPRMGGRTYDVTEDDRFVIRDSFSNVPPVRIRVIRNIQALPDL